MKKIFKQLLTVLLTIAVTALATGMAITPAIAQAPTELNVGTYLIAEEQGQQVLTGGIAEFIVRVINFLSGVIGSFAFMAIVIGGFMMLASTGNETYVQRGKDIIKYAVIGLVIALSAYFITAFVQSAFYEL